MRLWLLPLILGCTPPSTVSGDGSYDVVITEHDASAPTASSAPVSWPLPCIVNGVYHMPNPDWTIGVLCSKDDPDFDGYRYDAHVAHCNRGVGMAEKDQVAKLYSIPKADYSKYEFDHFIPLNAGGSNSPHNLWPQPLDEAKLKDKVEDEVYNGLKNGTMTQDVAVAKIRAWHSPACP